MKTLWNDTEKLPAYPTLAGDEETDILVIGGGLSGILCAYLLQEAGERVLVCEADTVGSGTTAGTTAVLSVQHGLYCEFQDAVGSRAARAFLDANTEALSDIRLLCKDECDLEARPSCIYSLENYAALARERDFLVDLGLPATLTRETELPLRVAAAVCLPGQAQFHPLKFLHRLCAKLPIREHARIVRVWGTDAYTDRGFVIHAKKIVIATHFPVVTTRGLYAAKLYQMRSFIRALEGVPTYSATYDSYESGGYYFRDYKGLLLVGGGDRRTGSCGGEEKLNEFVKACYPSAHVKYSWSAQDCMSLDGLPYAGPYSRSLKNVYVMSGYNEWGMTTSMACARVVSAAILGRPCRYAEAFSPRRNMLHKQLFANLGTTLADLFNPKGKRCPHMGAALRWDPDQRTWECPCHGSRFDSRGDILEGPAYHPLNGA